MVKTVYYRGLLRSCNYRCGYCPFSSQSSDLVADEEGLGKFCDKISTFSGDLTIVLAPYGEALIHKYYHKAIARLCQYDFVKAVSCQTNLSFDVKEFAAEVAVEKVSLWCSFHPSQVKMGDFLQQCELLQEHGINFCVGAVGDPANIGLLRELRNGLCDDVYMWINAMDGLRRDYTGDEVKKLTEIDPLFELELHDFAAAPKKCHAGRESIFVDGRGDYFACNISRVKLGNLYTGEVYTRDNICRAKKCHCYLAYSNRNEMADIFLNAESIPLRTPSPKKAIFFDVDGTLTDESGSIPHENIKAVRELSQGSLIFLATSLPYKHAKRKCKAIWEHIAGGAFAEGSDIRIFDRDFKRIIPLDEKVAKILADGARYIRYHEDGVLHKVAVLSGAVADCGDFSIVPDKVVGIVAKGASKLNGVLCICRELRLLAANVTAIGNGANDVPMLRYFANSIAVPTANEAAKAAARVIAQASKPAPRGEQHRTMVNGYCSLRPLSVGAISSMTDK